MEIKIIYSENFGIWENEETKDKCFICSPEIKIEPKENMYFPPMTEFYDVDDDWRGAKVNFNYGIFDMLDELELSKLESIMSFSNEIFYKDFVDKDIWKPFIFTSNINLAPIKKSINIDNDELKYNTKDFNSKEIEKISDFYKDKNTTFNLDIVKSQKKLYEKIFLKLFINDNDNKLKPKVKVANFKLSKEHVFPREVVYFIDNFYPMLIISNETTINSKLHMLYSFLDCLFNSEFNFYIKKCRRKDCEKFFVTANNKEKYCQRYYECSTCSELMVRNSKNNYEKNNLERNINSTIYSYRNVGRNYDKELHNKRISFKDEYLKIKNSKKTLVRKGELSIGEYEKWLLQMRTKIKNKDYTI